MSNEIDLRPEHNTIYVAEMPRLSAIILGDLQTFELSPSTASLNVFYNKSITALARSIVRVTEYAYVQGCKDALISPNSSDLIKLKRDANDYGLLAAKQIARATANSFSLEFSASLSKRYATSKIRADLITGDQLRKAYFRGIMKAWSQIPTAMKRWVVADSHDKDDTCDDNADDGLIEFEEPFQSGDFEPPAHINCTCFLRVSRWRM